MIPETDDYKDDNKDMMYRFDINEDNYEKLFEKLRYRNSKKLVHYLMYRVTSFGTDFNNPTRLKIMKQLTAMKKPYKKVFDEDFLI